MSQKEIISKLENKWSANIVDNKHTFHIFGLKKWNFIPTEVIELVQSLGTIEMVITENFEFVVRKNI